MSYEHLQQEAFEANMLLPELKLVWFTFGNVSAADHSRGVFAIKPSGVLYEDLHPRDMVVVDFDGKVLDHKLRPSSDTLTHACLYRQWSSISGICHTHSSFATSWAQALRDIPIYGTTHADHTTHDIPCASPMDDERIKSDYEVETGYQILKGLEDRGLDPLEMQMILVGSHAPFTWGATAKKAVYNSAVLEEIAKMAFYTEHISPIARPLKDALIQKHYERKHGPNSYYGQ